MFAIGNEDCGKKNYGGLHLYLMHISYMLTPFHGINCILPQEVLYATLAESAYSLLDWKRTGLFISTFIYIT